MKTWILAIFLCVAPVAGMCATPAVSGTPCSATASTSTTVTCSLSVTSGDKILVWGMLANTSVAGTLSIADSQSNSYTVLKTYNNGNGNYALHDIWTATASATGSITITQTKSGGYDQRFWGADISGYSALDQQGATNNSAGIGLTITVTASAADTSTDLVIAGVLNTNNDASHTLTHPATTGYTEGYYDNGHGSFGDFGSDVSYKTGAGSGTTESAGWSWTTSTENSTAVIISIKGAGSTCTHSGYTSAGGIATPNGSSGSYWLKNGSFGTPDCSTVNYWQPALSNFGVN